MKFVGITSSAGGSGCTSLCLCLSRLLSKAYEKGVIYISFDPLSMKTRLKNSNSYLVKKLFCDISKNDCKYESVLENYFSKDEFGVYYLPDDGIFNPLHFSTNDELLKLLSFLSMIPSIDYMVIDIPFNSPESFNRLSICENIVVCEGYTESQVYLNNMLLELLKQRKQVLAKKPIVSIFKPSIDADSFFENDVDMHGEFAGEVRKLAFELFSEL